MRIDLHAHLIPPEYVKIAKSRSLTAGGGHFPEWSPEMHVDFMGNYEISVSVLSISDPGPYIGANEREAVSIARTINEYSAALAKEYPSHFRALATLPVHDIDASLEELTYAMDVLDLDGVGLLTSHADVYLGDERLDPLFEELDRRSCYVFIHPGTPSAQPGIAIPPWVLEFPFESTRAAANLIFKGTLQRFPNTKLQLAHTGGTFPYLAQRIAWLATSPSALAASLVVPQNPYEQFSRFYFDTAMTTNRLQLELTQLLVGPTRLVFGSDYPFSQLPPPPSPSPSLDQLEDKDRHRIEVDNALELVPRAAKIVRSKAP